MNVLFVSPTFHPHRGGAESLFDDLTRVAVERGHRVDVIAEATGPPGAVETRHGASVHRVRYPRASRRPRALLRFGFEAAVLLRWHWRLLREREIETVVVARLDEKSWYVVLLRPLHRVRLVVYLHGAELRRFARESRTFRLLLRASFRASDAVVAVSAGLADEAIRFLPAVAPKLVRLPNGIDVARLLATSAARRARRYFLFVGRLARVKNPDVLVEAFARIADALPDVDLVLVGSGELREPLERSARDRGLAKRIEFRGDLEREEVYALLKGAELLVLPSLAEASPLVLLEAFAAGKMVIGSDVKGVRDGICDGVDGALFHPTGPTELATLLLRYADPTARAEIEATIRERPTDPLDIRHLADRHLALWRETRAPAPPKPERS